jgi:hypothetical protein
VEVRPESRQLETLLSAAKTRRKMQPWQDAQIKGTTTLNQSSSGLPFANVHLVQVFVGAN